MNGAHPLLEELRARCAEIADLEKVSYLLDWDEETQMPRGGGEERLRQKAALQRVLSERWTSDRLAELVEALAPVEAELDPHSDEAALIRVVRADVARARCVPVELQVALANANAHGYHRWLEARERRDFDVVRPQLERVVALRREYAATLCPGDDPYDALLAEWEPGLTARDLDAILGKLKPELRSLLSHIGAEPFEQNSDLAGPFPVDGQRRLTLWLLELWGFDREHWRLDDGVHPSEYSLALADVRITARFDPETLDGVFECLHEFGHGLCRRQVAPGLSRTPLREPASSGVDEATARLLENLVGRRLSTWRFAYPRAQDELGLQLAGVPLERFYRAINEVRPSPIRATADEVTYGLHVVARYELERELVAGSLAPADLPEAFDARLAAYLGVRPKDVVEGVLQDPHWFDLGFGYFPTVTLGDIIAVQVWHRAESELGDLDQLLERGECEPLRSWLAEHLHAHGRKHSAPETIELAAGGPLDPRPYVAYLWRRYGELAETRHSR